MINNKIHLPKYVNVFVGLFIIVLIASWISKRHNIMVIRLMESELLKAEKSIMAEQAKSHALIESIGLGFLPNNSAIGNLIVTNELLETYAVQSIPHDRPLIVLRYSELNCDLCIDNQINIIKEYYNRINRKELIIVANHSNTENMLRFQRISNIPYSIYNCKSSIIDIGDNSSPYYFILDEHNIIRETYFPIKEIPQLTEKFLDAMIEKYLRD